MTVGECAPGDATEGTHVAVVRHPDAAFALLGSVQTTLIFTLASIAVPLPVIGHELGLRRPDLILLSASYGLTFAGLLLFGSRLADRYGGRRALTVVTTAGLGAAAAGLGLLAATGLPAHAPYAYGLLPGLVLLAAGTAASFGGAAVLATAGVPPTQSGLAGGVLNSAMELGPTVLFALLLTLGSDALSLAATGSALALTALLNHRASH
ncbi:MFS transporter [Streptomyces sp. NPDC001743]|uniref:MFS transporter n=1 Tax=Streptomyces sp. NPDC001743 TaxID=3154397 RepID=UPI0033333208